MIIKVNKFNDYLSILYKNKDDIHFISRIQIVDNMISFDNFSYLTEEEKERFLDFTSSYWFESDLEYNNLYDVCYLVNENKLYQKEKYADFVKALDELV